MDGAPETVADALVRQLNRGDTDPASLLERLGHSRRPYYAWALAWAQWSGVLDRRPDHETARRAVAALRAVEPLANRLEMIEAVASGSRATG